MSGRPGSGASVRPGCRGGTARWPDSRRLGGVDNGAAQRWEMVTSRGDESLGTGHLPPPPENDVFRREGADQEDRQHDQADRILARRANDEYDE